MPPATAKYFSLRQRILLLSTFQQLGIHTSPAFGVSGRKSFKIDFGENSKFSMKVVISNRYVTITWNPLDPGWPKSIWSDQNFSTWLDLTQQDLKSFNSKFTRDNPTRISHQKYRILSRPGSAQNQRMTWSRIFQSGSRHSRRTLRHFKPFLDDLKVVRGFSNCLINFCLDVVQLNENRPNLTLFLLLLTLPDPKKSFARFHPERLDPLFAWLLWPDLWFDLLIFSMI